MDVRFVFGALAVSACAATVALADQPASMLLPSGGGEKATFRYTTQVKTPQGTHSSAGTITVTHTQGRSLTVAIRSDDGKTQKTIPLTIGSGGTVGLDPSAPAPSGTSEPDAAARAFMADVTLAAHVGIGARKNADASAFSVPVTLTPVGDGTPVPATLRMTKTATGKEVRYSGTVSGNTMTKLPPGGLSPAAVAKTIGTGAIVHHLFGPVGRVASAVVMHERREKEKKAAAGLVPDSVDLSVTTRLSDGRFVDITGTQNDAVTIADKHAKITSTWTFTKMGTM